MEGSYCQQVVFLFFGLAIQLGQKSAMPLFTASYMLKPSSLYIVVSDFLLLKKIRNFKLE